MGNVEVKNVCAMMDMLDLNVTSVAVQKIAANKASVTTRLVYANVILVLQMKIVPVNYAVQTQTKHSCAMGAGNAMKM